MTDAKQFRQTLTNYQNTPNSVNNSNSNQTTNVVKTPIQSAFFGLDNGVGRNALDGLVVSFAAPLESSSLNPQDFEIIDAAGNRHTPHFATLRPANEPGENRSVLLIGEFGNAGSNPPAAVNIIGDLYTQQGIESGQISQNLRGAYSTDIAPLSAGPELFHAETLPLAQSEFPDAVEQVVQVAWQGGVVPVSGAIPESELARYYTVYTDAGDGTLTPHIPLAIGDINDNDNYHQLLVNTNEPIVKVAMGAGVVQDPNGDPNPETMISLNQNRF